MEHPITTTSTFLTEDFLLQNDFSRRLYNDYAKNLPIVDYHCHLPAGDIADDRQFANLTTAWLNGYHYKWWAMRTLGIVEKFITGDATDAEKFHWWAYAVPFTIRNPLYHWTQLELKRYFDVDKLLTVKTESEIFQECSEKLNMSDYRVLALLRKMNVEVVCTTNDPIHPLDYHRKISSENSRVKVLPTFRPDKAFEIDDPSTYGKYLDQLSDVSGIEIKSFASLLAALNKRIEFFHQAGCRLSDHGLEYMFYPQASSTFRIEDMFWRVKKGEQLSAVEIQYYKYSVLMELCRMYHAKGWAQQFHQIGRASCRERVYVLV